VGRRRLKRLFAVALSLDAAAEAIQVPRRVLSDAAYVDGTLPIFQGPTNSIRRVLVSDLEKMIRETWPRAKIKRHLKRVEKSR
jgi:hypothetical protein